MANEGSEAAAVPSGPPQPVRIPLHARSGEIRAFALVDSGDAHLVGHLRWHMRDGYAVRNLPPPPGKKHQGYESMARVILGLTPGDGLESDHISRDKLDNRRSNLRAVTHAQNMQNRVRTDGNSKHRGVSRRKGVKKRPWHAYGCKEGKQFHLGFFDTEDEAADAARAWRREHLPFAME